MSDYNWCHGPKCHTSKTQDRIRGVKGSKVLRTRKVQQNAWNENSFYRYFCSNGCTISYIISLSFTHSFLSFFTITCFLDLSNE